MLKTIMVAIVATFAMAGMAQAQQLPAAANQTANIKRPPLQKFDVPGTNLETVIAIAEIVPNVMVGKHPSGHRGRLHSRRGIDADG